MDAIFPCMEPTITPNQKNRGKVWGLITEALIDSLHDVDEKVIDLIKRHIIIMSENLYNIMKKKRNKNAPLN